MSVPTVLIMAAGRGTRMRSKMAKVLHPLCGRPLLLWPVEAAREANAERIVVVLDPAVEEVRRVLPPGVEIATQHEQKGTGDAVISARDQLERSESVIVLSGDHPLVDSAFLEGLAERHASSGAAATIATHVLENPGEYGRIVRGADDEVERIVETKTPGDATADELSIKEINIGTYAFRTKPFLEALDRLRPENAQRELYLGDVVPLMRGAGERVVAYRTDDEGPGLGINTRADLALVREICQEKIHERLMLAGVTITDPASTIIDVDVRVGEDTVVDPYTFLHGQVAIGSDCRIGPMTTLIDCAVGNGVLVLHSYLTACEVLDGCKIGPFSYIRPGTRLGEEVKQGAFTEIKNSNIGEGAKIPHLSYVGDADVGEGANLAAGNIVANWDGRRKHRTVIGADVKTGVHTTFIAPLNVGNRAYTGAGSVITDDIPEGALGIARAPQQNVEGYADRVDAKAQAEDGDEPTGAPERAEAGKSAKKPVSEGGKQS